MQKEQGLCTASNAVPIALGIKCSVYASPRVCVSTLGVSTLGLSIACLVLSLSAQLSASLWERGEGGGMRFELLGWGCVG